MTLFDDRRERAEKTNRIEQDLIEAKRIADAREPKVNALWKWFAERRVSNGIGRDFEWTLAQPRRGS